MHIGLKKKLSKILSNNEAKEWLPTSLCINLAGQASHSQISPPSSSECICYIGKTVLWWFFFNHQICQNCHKYNSICPSPKATSTAPQLRPMRWWQKDFQSSWLSLTSYLFSPFLCLPFVFQWLLQPQTPLLVQPWTPWPLLGLCKDWLEPLLDWIILMH